MRQHGATFRWGQAFLLLVLAAGSAQAQERQVPVRVEAIAGANVYLDAGTEAGLAAGDTLQLLREGDRLGPMLVVSVTATRSVVTFLHDAFPVTRGERLAIVLPRDQPAPSIEPEPEPLPPEGDRASIFERPTVPRGAPAPRNPIRLTGRLQFGSSALWSSTTPSTGSEVSRQFATPFVGVRATLQGLPLQTKLNINGRLAYRYRSGSAFEDPTDLRLYQASVESGVGPVQVEVGRIYNVHDRFSGYHDGVRVHVGHRDYGVGVTAGVQTQGSDAAVATDLPRYTVYAHYELTPRPFRVEVAAVAGQVLPRTEGLANRTFAGFSQRASSRLVTVSTDVFVDQDPADGSWTFSRLNLRAAWRVLPQLRLHGQFLRRRPYLLFESLQVLRDVSSRYGGGASYTLGWQPLRSTVLRADVSVATAGGVPASLTYSGGAYIPRLPVWDLGLSTSVSVWTREGQESVYASAGLTRSFGRTAVSLGYRYQQTPLLTESLVTHGVEGTLQLPIRPGVSATVQGSAQFGEAVSTVRVYTGLWWRL